jgi:uncharacterized protein DUF6438
MLNLILATVLMAQAAQQPAVDAIAVTTQEAVQHRTSNRLFLRVAREQRVGGSFPYVQVAVTLDAGGAVVSANAVRGADYDPAIYADAESLVRTLHYMPFVRIGHLVAVKFSEYVSLLPPELKPEVQLPFPKVKDLASVKITLRRTSCFGACPAYRVEVHGDGTVRFQWEGYDVPTQVYDSTIPREDVMELLKLFEEADFYSLRDNYRLGASDTPTYFTSIEIDGQRKQVEDDLGWEMGMPLAVSELEAAIDRISGAGRWVEDRRR